MLEPVALVLGGCRVTNAADAVPVISTASVPLYPEIAQSARVQGSVRIRVTTDGKTSHSHREPLLGAAETLQADPSS